MTKQTEQIPFKLLHMECCGHLLCWVNPRYPSYCPECGDRVYPQVKGWATFICDKAILKYEI